MTYEKSRTALVVGGGDPADSVGVGLVAAGWSLLRLGDEPIYDETISASFPTLEHLDLVVHARYPSACRQRMDLCDLTAQQWSEACDEPLESGIRLARAAHEPLRTAKGTIIYLVPLMASAGGDGFAAFAGAAEGLRLLAKSLAKDLGCRPHTRPCHHPGSKRFPVSRRRRGHGRSQLLARPSAREGPRPQRRSLPCSRCPHHQRVRRADRCFSGG